MKQMNLSEYTVILANLGGYQIYEHPTTFHHVMTLGTNRRGEYQEDVVAEWSMPGLASDGDITVPPGFIREVVKKFGAAGKKGKAPRQAVEVDTPDELVIRDEVPVGAGAIRPGQLWAQAPPGGYIQYIPRDADAVLRNWARAVEVQQDVPVPPQAPPLLVPVQAGEPPQWFEYEPYDPDVHG